MGCFRLRKLIAAARALRGNPDLKAVYRFAYDIALLQLREGATGEELRRKYHEAGPVSPVLLEATSDAEEVFEKESRAVALVAWTVHRIQAGVPLGDVQLLLRYWHGSGFWERCQVMVEAKRVVNGAPG